MKNYKDFLSTLSEDERMARADYKVGPSGRKSHKEIVFHDGSTDQKKDDELKREEVELSEESQKHVVHVTVSDPHHTMVSKRKETVQKRATVTAKSRESAVDTALNHYKKQGYKVHDHNYVGLKEEVELQEGAYEKSEENKRSADAAKKQGDMFAHHLHMADHHDNLAQWHAEKGRHSVADTHAAKAEEHHEKAMKLKEEVEVLDEKSEQARRNKTMKNTMDAARGARWKVQNKVSGDAVRDWDNKHKTAQAQNKAIGRALRNEEAEELDEAVESGNKGYGYHGAHPSETADKEYSKAHSTVKKVAGEAGHLRDAKKPNQMVKHYLDSRHGRHLADVGTHDHEYIKKDFGKFKKSYKPEMHEGVDFDQEGNLMAEKKTYAQFMEQLLEYTPGPGGVTRVQGRSYGAQYHDPEGDDDADDKPKAKPAADAPKRGRGRPAGSKSGANQKVTSGKSYGGIATHSLHLPNTNR